MNAVALVLLLLFVFLLGYLFGHSALKSTLAEEGFVVKFNKDRPLGKGRWRIYRRTLLTYEGDPMKE